MSSAKLYIGCKIGLISKAQNRYEGILYTIDTVNSTVVLAQVKCFGTEGRPTDRPAPPKDDIYDYITFRGSDIKDIALCEAPRSPHDRYQDPAILQSSGGSSSGLYYPQGPFSSQWVPSYHQLAASSLLNQQYAAAFGLGTVLQCPQVRRAPMVEKAVQTMPLDNSIQRRGLIASQNQRWDSRWPQGNRRESSQTRSGTGPTSKAGRIPGMSGNMEYEMKSSPGVFDAQQGTSQEWNGRNYENFPPPRRGQGYQRCRNRSRGPILRFETDFDFDSSNAQFIQELEREIQHRLKVKEGSHEGEEILEQENSHSTENNLKDGVFGPTCYYDKAKSFFDNISSDHVSRRTWAEEQKLNVETFGVPGQFLRGQGFRGGYYGGRGWGTAPGFASQRAWSGQR